jgi:hypothetical protein
MNIHHATDRSDMDGNHYAGQQWLGSPRPA